LHGSVTERLSMRLVYADPHQAPSHWFRNAVLVAALAVVVFFALLVLAVRLSA
jgi:hypothetical protein